MKFECYILSFSLLHMRMSVCVSLCDVHVARSPCVVGKAGGGGGGEGFHQLGIYV